MGLSKMDKKCKNCKHKDNCDNKRMIDCSEAKIQQANMIGATLNSNMIPCCEPLMRKRNSYNNQYGRVRKKRIFFRRNIRKF
ncbi:hypothetical protein [Clostridium perfringens]|uniref:Uncharacterized protein n=1 Tax=Clostridium perfringens TaxID=1502 RepID=A0AAP4EDM0_CLOPF|nr:hypothetical protein [Clostridium perfringens]MDH2334578.1 hypothetical protein [Clostridium perfringens]